MLWIELIACFSFILFESLVTTFDYCHISKNHLLCLSKVDSICGDTNKASVLHYAKLDRDILLDSLNTFRNDFAGGKLVNQNQKPYPTVANMEEMEWDEEMAILSKGRYYTGQTIYKYSTKGSTAEAVIPWYEVVDSWTTSLANIYSGTNLNTDKEELIATQNLREILTAQCGRVGCATVIYRNSTTNASESITSCHFGPIFRFHYVNPFIEGKPCTLCLGGKSCSKRYPNLCSATDRSYETATVPIWSGLALEPRAILSFDYCKVDSMHLLCGSRPDSRCGNWENVKTVRITNETKASIVEILNKFRNDFAGGKIKDYNFKPYPRVANMMEMQWDEQLATLSKALVRLCAGKQTSNYLHQLERHYTGQLIHTFKTIGKLNSAQLEWKQIIDSWGKYLAVEYNGTNINIDTNPSLKVKYLKQIIMGETRKVGCATVLYRNSTDTSAHSISSCHFAPIVGEYFIYAFEDGDPCSRCFGGKGCSTTYKNLCKFFEEDEGLEYDTSNGPGSTARSTISLKQYKC